VDLQLEQITVDGPVIAIHGGAGPQRDLGERRLLLLESLDQALAAGWAELGAGGSALDAVVAAVAAMEASGRFNAGRGAVRTSAGTVELDAAVMDGATGAAGAVCACTYPQSPVALARAVAEQTVRHGAGHGLAPQEVDAPVDAPVLLAGPGADALAQRLGLPARSGPGVTSDPATSATATAPLSPQGTVGAVAIDRHGHLAAATSTGGREHQPPGRVGDSPVLGAGTWAEDATVAVSATGVGEAFLLAGFAHRVAWGRQTGGSTAASVRSAFDAVTRWGGEGGAIVVDSSGGVVLAFDSPAMARGWRHLGGTFSGVGRHDRPPANY
jgi:beta-aspartyl-peptidase (threonine type)